MPSASVTWKGVGIVAVAALLASILWSMWVDTLRPIIREGDTQGAVLTAFGLALALLGLALIVRGGWMAVSGGLGLFTQPEFAAGVVAVRKKTEGYRKARRENLRRIGRAMGPGVLLMLAAFGCFGLGGWLVDL